MMTVYRYIFYVDDKNKIVGEEDITSKIPTIDWEYHVKKWTGRKAVSGAFTHCWCYYAVAEVQDDGSFKVV